MKDLQSLRVTLTLCLTWSRDRILCVTVTFVALSTAREHRRAANRLAGNRHATGAAVNESNELHKGDEVSWRTHGTTTHGTVQDRLTSDTRAVGRTVRADEDHPQYVVRSDKSGRDAVHTAQALHRESPDVDPSHQESQ